MEPHLTAAEASLLATADADRLLRRTLEWSAINTGTGNLDGLTRQAQLLVEACAGLPGEVSLVDGTTVTKIDETGTETLVQNGRHLVLKVRPDAERRLLLTGHMDTVFPAGSAFQHVVEREPGVLNGPGLADMKGGLSVMLEALTMFERSTLAPIMGYDVMINSDEETGSASSAGLISQLAQGKHAALTYEPATRPDGTLAGARGGSGNYSLTVRGRSAHAGRNPGDGRNAIVAAAALATALKDLQSRDIPINPARIDGGSANNVVPDLAILRFNIRPRSHAAAAAFANALDALIASIAGAHDVQISVHGGVSRAPKPLDARAERLFTLVQQSSKDLGQAIGRLDTGGVCDGNNIAACGVPVVDTMGVRGGAIHSADEFLIVASLAERARLSALVLHRLAAGGLDALATAA
ncbi:hydrolase [Croceicoccus sp. F390]|uniref:Hydrolase n=1 Tax=Croceicoccus esteveae TaxID=3075597 RepID=A0ABU2ZGA2_9SPHN|nr:hydrolase [Croceicoccus sp. F390]MDT0575386.1 hydrolase [Croceicoccus sp. F390]